MLKKGIKFIGAFSWVGATATAIVVSGLISITSAKAQSNQPQPIFENVRIGSKFAPDPLIIRGISGGSVPARSVAGRGETPTGACVGYVDEQPDHTVELTSFFNYLSLQVQSPEDTTLIVRGPGGSWCNDDAQGKNPGIAGQWQPGTYRVWIGSYEKDQYHPYVIRMSEVQLLNPGPSRR